VNILKSQGSQHPDDFFVLDFLKFGGKAGRDQGCDPAVTFQQPGNFLGSIQYFFGTLAANSSAVAAADAAFRDNMGLAIGNSDGLGRTFTNTCITDSASLINRLYETRDLHSGLSGLIPELPVVLG
jgi:hypothetical protein